MDLKSAAMSSSIAVTSSVSSAAEGIEKAASQAGGISAVQDSFQGVQSAQTNQAKAWGDPHVQTNLQSAAMVDLPAQYGARLNEFQRNASGIVDSNSFLKSMNDQNLDVTANLKDMFANLAKELESQDKMGNFEIQQLMSEFNQSESLSSNVRKKMDDEANRTIGKIG